MSDMDVSQEVMEQTAEIAEEGLDLAEKGLEDTASSLSKAAEYVKSEISKFTSLRSNEDIYVDKDYNAYVMNNDLNLEAKIGKVLPTPDGEFGWMPDKENIVENLHDMRAQEDMIKDISERLENEFPEVEAEIEPMSMDEIEDIAKNVDTRMDDVNKKANIMQSNLGMIGADSIKTEKAGEIVESTRVEVGKSARDVNDSVTKREDAKTPQERADAQKDVIASAHEFRAGEKAIGRQEQIIRDAQLRRDARQETFDALTTKPLEKVRREFIAQKCVIKEHSLERKQKRLAKMVEKYDKQSKAKGHIRDAFRTMMGKEEKGAVGYTEHQQKRALSAQKDVAKLSSEVTALKADYNKSISEELDKLQGAVDKRKEAGLNQSKGLDRKILQVAKQAASKSSPTVAKTNDAPTKDAR